jgi:hypothetical protein
MSTVRKLSIFVLAFGFFITADPVSYVLQGSLTSTAEAIIGAPATPASYAAVARRTTRRCAAGVYRC